MILWCATTKGQTSADKQIVFERFNFGSGYNSATHQEFFGVIDYSTGGESIEVLANAIGNSGTVEVSVAEDKNVLKDVLSISNKIELDLKIKGFSSSSSFREKIYRESTFTDFEQVAVVKARYVNEPKVIIDPQIKNDLVKLAKRNPEKFMADCGDMFVSKIYTGGEIIGYFNLHSRDEYERRENQRFFQSINGYLGNQLSLTTESSRTIETTNNVSQKKIYVYTSGGEGSEAINDLRTFLDYAYAFKSDVRTDKYPVTLFVELSPYESINGFPNIDFSKIRVDQRVFLQEATILYNMLEKSINNATFVNDNYLLFDEDDIIRSNRVLEGGDSLLNELTNLIDLCRADFNESNLDLLQEFRDLELFNPTIDYPNFGGAPQDLPVSVEEGYQTVFPNTQDNNEGKFLQIFGELESEDKLKPGSYSCKPVSYFLQRSYIYTKKKVSKNYWNRYRYHWPIYEQFTRPYYMIRFVDVASDMVLSETPWSGTPIAIRNNTRIDIKLVNPNSVLVRREGDNWYGYYDNGYPGGPKFLGVRACNGLEEERPKAAISSNRSIVAERPATSNIQRMVRRVEGGIDADNTVTIGPEKLHPKGSFFTYNYNN